MKIKQCSVCKRFLPATTDYFYKRKDRPGGLRSECKQCVKEASIQWGKDNPDKKNAKNSRYNKNIANEITDVYVKKQLAKQINCNLGKINLLPNEIIDAKRNQLKLIRCQH